MSEINEVMEALKSLESGLAGYMGYDSMVGGLVSRSIKTLAEVRQILGNPTKKNIQEALKKVKGCKDSLSPYAGYAPDLVRKADLVIGKLRTL